MEHECFEVQVKRGNENLKNTMTPDELKKKGIVTFAGAEMDFPTAPCVLQSIRKLVDNGLFGFTLISDEYRDRVAFWMKNVRKSPIETKWIVPTYGTIYSLATAIKLATAEGEGVIVQEPGYTRYRQAIQRLDRKVIVNRLKEVNGKYEMDFEQLEQQMAKPENHLMVLCNPHNPIGRVWKEQELGEIARLAEKYNVLVYSDEIFAEVVFDGNMVIPFVEICPSKAITCISLGKCFNFTGVNHANVLIANEVLRERFIHQRNRDHYGSLEPFAYAAVLGAYTEEGIYWKDNMVSLVKENRDKILKLFEKYNKHQVFPVEGTFVAWIKWSEDMPAGEELVRYLEKEALFSVDSGSEYGEGLEHYTRMNLATTREQMNALLLRLEKMFDAEKEGTHGTDEK